MRIFAKGIVADTLTLKAGTDVLKLKYRFNADANWAKVNKIRLDMFQESEKENPDAIKIGSLTLDLFVLVFGKDCTDQLLKFFEGSFESLIKNISPVFKYDIYPACAKARKRAIKERKAMK